jgi:hypothetical protein
VIYSAEPKCLCMSLANCCGVPIYHSPCTCCNLKMCLCFGGPCYTICGQPIVRGLSPEGAEAFLKELKFKTGEYNAKHGLDEKVVARFEMVNDQVLGGEVFDNATAVVVDMER